MDIYSNKSNLCIRLSKIALIREKFVGSLIRKTNTKFYFYINYSEINNNNLVHFFITVLKEDFSLEILS